MENCSKSAKICIKTKKLWVICDRLGDPFWKFYKQGVGGGGGGGG